MPSVLSAWRGAVAVIVSLALVRAHGRPGAVLRDVTAAYYPLEARQAVGPSAPTATPAPTQPAPTLPSLGLPPPGPLTLSIPGDPTPITLTVPSISLPSLSIPGLSLPSISLPALSALSLPSISLPSISLPALSLPSLPNTPAPPTPTGALALPPSVNLAALVGGVGGGLAAVCLGVGALLCVRWRRMRRGERLGSEDEVGEVPSPGGSGGSTSDDVEVVEVREKEGKGAGVYVSGAGSVGRAGARYRGYPEV
ncbi:hypothetical protein PsYK624_129330 [Phanerochaete sordida]|uniref:Uncharacterized protein n=1 Tax=Phanerochaete sordida TaxID=48140 RepID=A0A9P3GJL8_9APHY|nr:hypothetical protein PsYK624_129330 [Phanerochaete sordida]